MTKPRATIVIPTYNRAQMLERAIASAISQTEEAAVIVVNHGSSDETRKVAKKFGSLIEYIERSEDFGPIFSWIDGTVHAKTEYSKLLFDDDFLDPSYIETGMKYAGENIGYFVSNASLSDPNGGRVFAGELFSLPGTGVFRTNSIRGEIMAAQMVSPSALLMRTEDLLAGLTMPTFPLQQNFHFGAGPDHLVKLFAHLKYSKFAVDQRSLVSFGYHEQSITISSSRDYQSKHRLQGTYRDAWLLFQQIRLSRFLRPALRIMYIFGYYLGRRKVQDTNGIK